MRYQHRRLLVKPHHQALHSAAWTRVELQVPHPGFVYSQSALVDKGTLCLWLVAHKAILVPQLQITPRTSRGLSMGGSVVIAEATQKESLLPPVEYVTAVFRPAGFPLGPSAQGRLARHHTFVTTTFELRFLVQAICHQTVGSSLTLTLS